MSRINRMIWGLTLVLGLLLLENCHLSDNPINITSFQGRITIDSTDVPFFTRKDTLESEGGYGFLRIVGYENRPIPSSNLAIFVDLLEVDSLGYFQSPTYDLEDVDWFNLYIETGGGTTNAFTLACRSTEGEEIRYCQFDEGTHYMDLELIASPWE